MLKEIEKNKRTKPEKKKRKRRAKLRTNNYPLSRWFELRKNESVYNSKKESDRKIAKNTFKNMSEDSKVKRHRKKWTCQKNAKKRYK